MATKDGVQPQEHTIEEETNLFCAPVDPLSLATTPFSEAQADGEVRVVFGARGAVGEVEAIAFLESPAEGAWERVGAELTGDAAIDAIDALEDSDPRYRPVRVYLESVLEGFDERTEITDSKPKL